MTARKTVGVELQKGDGSSSESFTKVAEIVSINGPESSRSEIDITDLDSVAMEFVAGLKDHGSCSFDLIWDEKETTHETFQADFDAGTTDNYRIVVPDGSPNTTITFPAFINQLGRAYQVNDVVRASAGLRVAGDLTIDNGS